jgi:hypothetical protein
MTHFHWLKSDAIAPMDSPNKVQHISQKHCDTLTRFRIFSETQMLKTYKVYSLNGTKRTQKKLFQELNVPNTSARRISESQRPRRHSNEPESRGRRHKLSESDLRRTENLLFQEGYEARILDWITLAIEANVPGSGRTLRREFKTRGYRRCIACRRRIVSQKVAEARVKYAREMLTKYATPEDWRNVRFSEEVHLRFGPEGRIYVIRKPGEGSYPNCAQETKPASNKDEKKVHCWGAVGHNFKSPLIR